MRVSFPLFLTGLLALSLFSEAGAQPWPVLDSRTDTWNNMGLTENNYGILGSGYDECPGGHVVGGCEMPPGSYTSYLSTCALWIGAVIDSAGYLDARVSTASDGWLNPSVNEMWPGAEPSTVERSTHDTVNCFGEPIYDPAAVADHEIEMTFSDTLRDEPYVPPDFDGTVHRPLGLEITRTVYSTPVLPCSYIYWVKYHVENIGQFPLREIYLGHLIMPDVGNLNDGLHHTDDVVGFEPTHEIAYFPDNDGRRALDSSGNNLTCPHVVGLMYLRAPGDDAHLSFNWAISNADVAYDYGPTWADAPDWSRDYGTPMGDARRYYILSNGEIDFDQWYTDHPDWIAAHPQGSHAWWPPDLPNAQDVANGWAVTCVFSMGPLGNHWYQDQHGRWIHRLRPGESFDVWMAIVGGRYFHNPDHPQPTSLDIDPSLFNFDDLFYHADIALNNLCVEWLSTREGRGSALPIAFSLEPVYPNPFNATANIRFALNRRMLVSVTVFDLLGRDVKHLAEGFYQAGHHELRFDAGDLASGLYFVQARTGGGQTAVQKAVLVK
jgi:hypothetical protein